MQHFGHSSLNAIIQENVPYCSSVQVGQVYYIDDEVLCNVSL